MSYAKQVPAAERVLRLLETLAATPDGLSAGELEETLQFSRSSLFALLNTLKAKNYIEQSDNRSRYRLGPALFALLPAQRPDLAQLLDAFQADADLVGLTETIALTRLDGAETIVMAQQESEQPVRVVLRVGQRRPASTSADGLVLLTGLPPDSLPPELTSTAAQIQQQGYAQTGDEDKVELACPICPDGHTPTAALLLSLPSYRWQPEETLFQTLHRAAARLSYRLGAPVYRPYGQSAAKSVGPTMPLSQTDLADFLRGAWGARLACVRPDGAPHVVPLWYEWDGQYFWVTASPAANWSQYIRQNPWVSLTIDEPWPPLRRALIVGQAQPATDDNIPGGIAGLRRRLTHRYLGQGASLSPAGQEGEWQAFKIEPQKITGQRGLGR